MRHLPSAASFIKRVYRTTAVAALVVASAVVGYFDWRTAANYVLGVAMGTGLLWVLERTVDLAIRKSSRSGGAIIVGLNVLKYAAVAAGLYLLATHGWIRLGAFLAGYGTIYAVIVLKVVGRLLVGPQGEDRRGESSIGPYSAGHAGVRREI